MALNDLRTLCIADVERVFPSKEIDKGYLYVGKVSDMSNDGRKLVAKVKGGERVPYKVSIVASGVSPRMTCSCYVGSGCKHAAAAMLSVALENKKTLEAQSPGLYARASKLESLSDVALRAGTGKLNAGTRGEILSRVGKRVEKWRESGPPVKFDKSGRLLAWDIVDGPGRASARPCWMEPIKGQAAARLIPVDIRLAIGAGANIEGLGVEHGGSKRAKDLDEILAVADESDMEAFGEMFREYQKGKTALDGVDLGGRESAAKLAAWASQGRLSWRAEGFVKLSWAQQGAGRLCWSFGDDGRVEPVCVGEGDERAIWLRSNPPMAVWANGNLGLAGAEPEVVARALDCGRLDYAGARALSEEMMAYGSGEARPAAEEPRRLAGKSGLKIVMGLAASERMPNLADYGGGRYPWSGGGERVWARLFHSVDGVYLPMEATGAIVGTDASGWVESPVGRYERMAAFQALTAVGLVPAMEPERLERMLKAHKSDWDPEEWAALSFWVGKFTVAGFKAQRLALLTKGKEVLRARGVEVVVENQRSKAKAVLVAESVDTVFTKIESGWFEMDIGVMVGGRRLDLAPLMAALFLAQPRWLNAAALEKIDDGEWVEFAPSLGEAFACEARRIKPFARHLADLASKGLKLEEGDAQALARARQAAQEAGSVGASGLEAVRKACEDAEAFLARARVEPPEGLLAELRPYQREGLDWLGWLAERDLAGILADDMGLGKTLQCLAHLLCEKRRGAGDLPSLAVLPTSLVFNWVEEAKKFAPGMKVVVLDGPDRKEKYKQIAGADLVLATYGVLRRDVELLAKQKFHLVVLDEAQNVKNISAKASSAIRRLDARRRLCVTGTPIENNLLEL